MPIPPDIAGLIDTAFWLLILFVIIILGVMVAERLTVTIKRTGIGTSGGTPSSSSMNEERELYRELLREIRGLRKEIRALREELRE